MYPDLAGRLAKSGQLGVESTQEHSAAKLDQMTYDEQTEMCVPVLHVLVTGE